MTYRFFLSFCRSSFQFQPVASSPGFSHYGAYGQDSIGLQSYQGHNNSSGYIEASSFTQDDLNPVTQYTNLNPIQHQQLDQQQQQQPMNVQQIDKLEPFSELLSGRYSYYGELESNSTNQQQQQHQQQQPQHNAGYVGKLNDVDKINECEQLNGNSENCDENFGEIIKKSMVETVSA